MGRKLITVDDLDPAFFECGESGLIALTVKFGLAGPYENEDDIADYENQSGRIEIVWMGGTAENPDCIYLVFPDDSRIKIKGIGEDADCEAIIECVLEEIGKGIGVKDTYSIPEMVGPTWQVDSSIYGVPAVSADFSGCAGTTLPELVIALNTCPNRPDGWEWKNVGGVLTLYVPFETNVRSISLAGGSVVEFLEPTLTGDEPSQICEAIGEFLVDKYGPGLKGGATAIGETSISDVEGGGYYLEGWYKWLDPNDVTWLSYYDVDNDTWLHTSSDELRLHLIEPVILFDTSSSLSSISYDASSLVPSEARFILANLNADNCMISTTSTDGYFLKAFDPDLTGSASNNGIADISGTVTNVTYSGPPTQIMRIYGYYT